MWKQPAEKRPKKLRLGIFKLIFPCQIKSPGPFRSSPLCSFYVESFRANQNCWKYGFEQVVGPQRHLVITKKKIDNSWKFNMSSRSERQKCTGVLRCAECLISQYNSYCLSLRNNTEREENVRPKHFHENDAWAFSNWVFSWQIKTPDLLRIFPDVVFYIDTFGAN